MPQKPPPRDYAPLNIWYPHIGKSRITTIEQLHRILKTEYPALKRNPQYPQLLRDAELHLTFIQLLKNKIHFERGDRKRSGSELGIYRQKFTAWAQNARQPRLYYELERTLSKTDAQAKITTLHHENNGIRSTDDVLNRLYTYYLTPLHEQSKQHEKRIGQCTLYFKTLDLLKDGGAYLDVARTLKIHHSQIMRWLNGQRPDYIELTRHIPASSPNSGFRWLPLNLDRAFVPTNFIQVPQVITHHKQILPVLNQLQPLTNKTMQRWQTRFGPPDKIDAFYYLLGLIASDFQKSKPRISSTELVLTLSKNYPWSQTLGDAACYYLGQLGIHAKQVKDRNSSAGPNTCHSWRSQKSPLNTWIMHTCLGLQPGQTTTYDPIYARWLLTAPNQLRIALLQGFADGDGWASIRDQCIGIYAGPNILLVQDLLQGFNIASANDGNRVRIRTQNGIIQAIELPLFRFAESRQNNANKIAEMMKARKKKKDWHIPAKVSKIILQLHKHNKSSGFIAEHIFDHFGLSYSRSSISWHIKIKEKASQQDS